ncbi:MAG TPA: HAD family phosphatase [Caproiciproducens sp.]|nr:HAD family phosphatase [Caproiciproducens sp.]
MIHAIVFDMDGVLFDTERMTAEIWKQVCSENHLTDVTRYARDYAGLNAIQIKKYFAEKFGADFPYDSFMHTVRERAAQKVEREGVPMKPGLIELLSYLKSNRYKIAAATSTSRATVMKYFDNAKITPYFDKIICGDMVEKSKPDPDIYLKAANALGVRPADCIGVEDSHNGVLSAFRAGMRTVMIPDTMEPTLQIRGMLFACVPTLSAIIPLLEEYSKNSLK